MNDANLMPPISTMNCIGQNFSIVELAKKHRQNLQAAGMLTFKAPSRKRTQYSSIEEKSYYQILGPSLEKTTRSMNAIFHPQCSKKKNSFFLNTDWPFYIDKEPAAFFFLGHENLPCVAIETSDLFLQFFSLDDFNSSSPSPLFPLTIELNFERPSAKHYQSPSYWEKALMMAQRSHLLDDPELTHHYLQTTLALSPQDLPKKAALSLFISLLEAAYRTDRSIFPSLLNNFERSLEELPNSLKLVAEGALDLASKISQQNANIEILKEKLKLQKMLFLFFRDEAIGP